MRNPPCVDLSLSLSLTHGPPSNPAVEGLNGPVSRMATMPRAPADSFDPHTDFLSRSLGLACPHLDFYTCDSDPKVQVSAAPCDLVQVLRDAARHCND